MLAVGPKTELPGKYIRLISLSFVSKPGTQKLPGTIRKILSGFRRTIGSVPRGGSAKVIAFGMVNCLPLDRDVKVGRVCLRERQELAEPEDQLKSPPTA